MLKDLTVNIYGQVSKQCVPHLKVRFSISVYIGVPSPTQYGTYRGVLVVHPKIN